MIEIGVYKVYKNFGYKKILDGINFEVLTGDRIGIVGKNGSGKSTICKLIMKKEYPDSGEIHIRKNATIGYLEQITEMHKQDTTTKDMLIAPFASIYKIEDKMHDLEEAMAIEVDTTKLEILLDKYANVQHQFMVHDGYQVEEKVNRVISGFKLHDILYTPFHVLSGGQKTIVALATLILQEPDILLLDEPTNHLDVTMMEWLETYLSKYNGTVIMISHDRYFLDRVSNQTIILEAGECRKFNGNYSYSLKEQEKLLLQEFAHYKTQQKKIAAMKAAIKRYRIWGHQADNEKFFKKAKELEKRLENMDLLEKPKLEKRNLPIHFIGERTGIEVLIMKNFGISFNDQYVFTNVNKTIYYQEKVALIGNNGSGKTSLIKAVIGDFTNYNGEVKLANNVTIGYIPQEIRFPNEKEHLLAIFCTEYPCLEGEARAILSKYGFYKDSVFKSVSMLSGGEKVLLKLAILIEQKVNFLILDEPTNHIDIETRETLEQAVIDYQGTLLFVSHDRYFINKVANRILEIKDYNIDDFYGTYNEYFNL